MSVEIEKNVPVRRQPGSRLSERNREIYRAMDIMEIGDSFLVAYDKNLAASIAKRAKVIGKRFSTSQQEDGKMRVWRVHLKESYNPSDKETASDIPVGEDPF